MVFGSLLEALARHEGEGMMVELDADAHVASTVMKQRDGCWAQPTLLSARAQLLEWCCLHRVSLLLPLIQSG